MTAGSRYASKVRSRARAKGETTGSRMDAILTDLIEASSNMRDVWPLVGEVWQHRQQRIFATGNYGKWAPLKVSTILAKRREGATTESLIHTGSMLHELSSTTPRAQGDHFVVFGPQRGAVIEYAKFHARGNGVPQRNPVPRLTPTERTNMLEKIRDHFRPEGMKKARP